MVTNDDEREPLDPATLEVGDENVLYCRVKGGEFRARFLRTAYYHLAARYRGGGERVAIVVGGRRYPIRNAPSAGPGRKPRRIDPTISGDYDGNFRGPAHPCFHIVLVRPEIPQNTGSIARTAAATRTRLHLVGPLGFSLEDRYLKRAGLDYWPFVDLRTYPQWEAFDEVYPTADRATFCISRRTLRNRISRRNYALGEFFVFGSETKGLGKEFLRTRAENTYRIPIFEQGVRSLNLSNAVSIVLYEALRQRGLLDRA